MQGWTRSTAEATNEELRRVRKEIARPGSAPLRIIIAGDPTKPVLSYTISRRLLGRIAVGAVVCVGAMMVGAFRTPSRPATLAAASLYPGLPENLLSARTAAEPTTPAQLKPIARPEAQLRSPTQADETLSLRGTAAGSPSDPAVHPPSDPAVHPPSDPAVHPPSDPAMHPPSDPAVPRPSEKWDHFAIEIANTGKIVDVYLRDRTGEPNETSYRALRHELRCQRTGAEFPIDPRLIELLHQIAIRTGERVQVVSAYRAPLRGDLNYHARGMAADIRVPGWSTADLRDLAKEVGARGIGYYPTVQFVHVDVRDLPFSWTDTSGHGEQLPAEDPQPNTEGAPPASAAVASSAAAPQLMRLSSPTASTALPALPLEGLGAPPRRTGDSDAPAASPERGVGPPAAP